MVSGTLLRVTLPAFNYRLVLGLRVDREIYSWRITLNWVYTPETLASQEAHWHPLVPVQS